MIPEPSFATSWSRLPTAATASQLAWSGTLCLSEELAWPSPKGFASGCFTSPTDRPPLQLNRFDHTFQCELVDRGEFAARIARLDRSWST